MCAHKNLVCVWRLEEGVGLPSAKITGDYELPNTELGTGLGSFGRGFTLSCRTISLAPVFIF